MWYQKPAPMKKLFFILTLSTLISCTGEKLDMNAARKTAETAIQLIGDQKFKEVSKLYSPEFMEGEPAEVRENKFSKIIEVIGNTEEFSILDSSRLNSEEINRIVLKYKVKHSNATTTETYTIVKEEGNYLLADIFITNQ